MKINEVEVVGNSFAYDGCHQIFLIENIEDEREALEFEYEILPIDKLEETFKNSCGLRFIRNWFGDKHYIRQFEDIDF